MDFRAPPVKLIADFLLYWLQDRKLQPSTIDGYRSAIADKLGNSPINASKDENLTHLLDSFHRDRPKGQRGISSWNLSLVLCQLRNSPSEPIKEPWAWVNAEDPCLAKQEHQTPVRLLKGVSVPINQLSFQGPAGQRGELVTG